MKHEQLEKKAGLMAILIAVAVSIGGLAEIIPLMASSDAVEAAPGIAQRHVGVTGSMIDPRLSVETVGSGVSAPFRAVWNDSSKRFVVTQLDNVPGVRQFVIDETAAEKAYGSDDRRSRMLYAASSDWIWDYQEVVASGHGICFVFGPSASKFTFSRFSVGTKKMCAEKLCRFVAVSPQ